MTLVNAGDIAQWYEQDDAIRVYFDSTRILERAGIPVLDAGESPEAFLPVLEQALGDVALSNELRSPGPQYGPRAGGGIESFVDVVISAKDLAETVAVAYLIAKNLKELAVGGVRVSEKGIELLSRRELSARGQPEDSQLVDISLIPMPAELAGPPPGYSGYAAVFQLADGRLVTMRWSLGAVLEDYAEGTATRP